MIWGEIPWVILHINLKYVIVFSLQIVLKPLLDIALNISQLEKFTGRNAPTVIT